MSLFRTIQLSLFNSPKQKNAVPASFIYGIQIDFTVKKECISYVSYNRNNIIFNSYYNKTNHSYSQNVKT